MYQIYVDFSPKILKNKQKKTPKNFIYSLTCFDYMLKIICVSMGYSVNTIDKDLEFAFIRRKLGIYKVKESTAQ